MVSLQLRTLRVIFGHHFIFATSFACLIPTCRLTTDGRLWIYDMFNMQRVSRGQRRRHLSLDAGLGSFRWRRYSLPYTSLPRESTGSSWGEERFLLDFTPVHPEFESCQNRWRTLLFPFLFTLVVLCTLLVGFAVDLWNLRGYGVEIKFNLDTSDSF